MHTNTSTTPRRASVIPLLQPASATGVPGKRCFGIACDIHGRCALYAAVEGSMPETRTIGTCMTDAGYPLFQELAA